MSDSQPSEPSRHPRHAAPPHLGRVLQVAQPVRDGVAVVVADWVAALAGSGWETIVACPPEGELAGWVEAAGGRVEPWPATRGPGRQVRDETRRLADIVARVRPDVVHLHSSKAGLAGRLAIRGKVPTIFSPHAWSYYHVHGALRRATVGWERAAARWTDVFLCGSAEEPGGGQQERISGDYRVLANTSSLPDPGWSRAQARSALGLPNDVPLAVCFGRFTAQKGQDLLLSLWPQVQANVPAARLALVGQGPLEAQYRQAASPDVLFGRADSQQDAARWILASDVMVFPSRWETLSLAVLESLQLGRAVVVSDCGGMAEALGAGAGRMFPLADAGRLAGALSELLANPALAAELGEQAKARSRLAHSARRAENVTAYRQLLAQVAGVSQPALDAQSLDLASPGLTGRRLIDLRTAVEAQR